MAIGTPVSLGVNSTQNGSGTTFTLNASSTASGKGRIVAAFAYTGNVTANSLTGGGLTWTVDVNPHAASNSLAIVSAGTSAGWAGGNIVLTFSASANIGSAAAMFLPGAENASSGFLDGTAVGSTGTGTAWSAGSVTLGAATSIVVAAVFGDTTGANVNAPTAPSTEVHDDFNSGFGIGLATEYRLPGSSGSYNLAGTFNFSRSIGAQAAVGYRVAAPTVSTAPTGVLVSASAFDQVDVAWTAPADDGGATITDYFVTPYIAGVAQTPFDVGSPFTTTTVTGLTTGTAYTFTVYAVNAVGNSAESAQSNTITPEIESNTGYGDGAYSTGTYGVRSGSSPAPPTVKKLAALGVG